MLVSYGRIPDHRDRHIRYVGGGFLLGASGGTVYHLIRGLRGDGGLAGGACAVRANVPRVAGWFGGYCAIFCALETAISRVRRSEDGWSSITAGAASMVVLNARRGAIVSAGAAVLGAAAFAVPMGIGWFLREWHHRVRLFYDHASLVLDVSNSTTHEVSTCFIERVKKRCVFPPPDSPNCYRLGCLFATISCG
jgi:mitochondrial import inner membrane translocase subunit TIM17